MSQESVERNTVVPDSDCLNRLLNLDAICVHIHVEYM